MSIQSSLSRWFAIQTLLGLSLVCAAVYAATSWSFQLRQDEEFDRHVEVVRNMLRDSTLTAGAVSLERELSDYFRTHSDSAVLLRRDGQLLYESPITESDGIWETRRTLFPATGPPVELLLSINVRSDRELLRRIALTLVLAAVLGTLIVSITGAILVRRGLAPLKKLAEETGVMAPELPGHRIDPLGYASELQPWIAQFNGLLGRVEAAYGQLEAFNAHVAHELRTPLSNMIAQAEVELPLRRSEEELKEVLSSLLEESRRLTGIVNDMLFLSKADRGALARRGRPESLAEQVRAVAEFREAALEDAGISLAIRGDADLAMDTGLVRRAISNLVSNAQRYATPGSQILVDIGRRGDEVDLAVENIGKTIDADSLPRLFERFYRADRSRAGSANHHGLGLAIVAAIARMHGGRTFAHSSDGLTRIGLSLRTGTGPAAQGARRSAETMPI